jgi:hypothetical protein
VYNTISSSTDFAHQLSAVDTFSALESLASTPSVPVGEAYVEPTLETTLYNTKLSSC